jgi:hypothetical protein
MNSEHDILIRAVALLAAAISTIQNAGKTAPTTGVSTAGTNTDAIIERAEIFANYIKDEH